jgi:ATP-dependent Clp protease protease subunit
MDLAASIGSDPRFPGFPPEVPFPPSPGPEHPRPGYPPVPMVPMPAPPAPADDFRSRVYDDLLGRRTVVLDRALDGETATLVAAQLMSLDAAGTDRITLVVNSLGGPIDAAAAVLDTMDLVRGPLDTTCLGRAEGTAAVVVASGTGRRRMGAGAQVRLRFADIELTGPATRLGDELAHQRELQRALLDRLVAITGQDRRLVERDVEAGRTLTADEAVGYGLADEVIGSGPGRPGPGRPDQG